MSFAEARKKRASIIGATGVFGTKIYKNVDSVFVVSPYAGMDKEIFKLLYFCPEVPARFARKSLDFRATACRVRCIAPFKCSHMTGAIHRTLPTFAEARKKRASIIGATCVFGTKIYINVDTVLAVTLYVISLLSGYKLNNNNWL